MSRPPKSNSTRRRSRASRGGTGGSAAQVIHSRRARPAGVAGPGAIVAVISEQEAIMATTSMNWQAQRVRAAAGLPEVLESA